MQKKTLCMVLAICIILYSAGAVRAAETKEFISGMGEKFVRGVINVFTGWVEIPAR